MFFVVCFVVYWYAFVMCYDLFCGVMGCYEWLSVDMFCCVLLWLVMCCYVLLCVAIFRNDG